MVDICNEFGVISLFYFIFFDMLIGYIDDVLLSWCFYMLSCFLYVIRNYWIWWGMR